MILLMIVKNEAHVIERALNSAYAVGIREAVILDTGSTDKTQSIALTHKDVRVRLYMDTEWQGFAHARNTVLQHAARMFPDEYGIMLDADDTIISLNTDVDRKADAYQTLIEHGDVTYARTNIFKLDAGWRYRGVVHEFPEMASHTADGPVVGRIRYGGDGSRATDPLKYIKDADAIVKALKAETDGTLHFRYWFYLAQSYRDAGHDGAATYWYKHVVSGYSNWSEERYISALNLGRITKDKKYFLHAAGINPKRAEAWRALDMHNVADMCVIDDSWLFVERDKYAEVDRHSPTEGTYKDV